MKEFIYLQVLKVLRTKIRWNKGKGMVGSKELPTRCPTKEMGCKIDFGYNKIQITSRNLKVIYKVITGFLFYEVRLFKSFWKETEYK